MFNRDTQPPVAKRASKITRIHNDTLEDPYFWLRETHNPEVIQYLEAENAYLETVLAPTQPLQEALYLEMLSRMAETDASVPVQDGPYFYYARSETSKQYPIYCRKRASTRDALTNTPEEILIDFNLLAEDKPFFSVTQVKVSPDHQKIAYLKNEDGTDYYQLHVKDISSQQDLIPAIDRIYIGNSLEWADGSRLFYLTANAQQRPHQLFWLSLETKVSTLLYQEADEAFFLHLDKSRSKRFIFLNSSSTDTSEVFYLDLIRPESALTSFAARVPGVSYDLEHYQNDFLILTDQKNPNFSLFKTPLDHLENWQAILDDPDMYLKGVFPFANHLVITGRQKGLTQIWVYTPDRQHLQKLIWPEPFYTINIGDNRTYNSSKVLINFQSMLTPPRTLELDLDTLATKVIKQEPINNYDPQDYTSTQIWATASDGTHIPISLIYKKDLAQPAPLMLYGYGAYGASYDPNFNANRVSLLERGIIIAIAHIRGGAEMGRQWYQQGKMLNKKNSFSDFIACADHLIDQGYTQPGLLAATGISAGGLLMGAVMNMRPELFRAVVAKVPFVDVINTMLDPSLPLVAIEHGEWGNPHIEHEYNYMKSYSPYDNIRHVDYPHLLVTAGFNDPRVPYWEPTKWVAKLRANKTDTNVLLFKTHMNAGHGGSSGRYGQLRDTALEYAFILTALNMQ